MDDPWIGVGCCWPTQSGQAGRQIAGRGCGRLLGQSVLSGAPTESLLGAQRAEPAAGPQVEAGAAGFTPAGLGLCA